MGLREQIFDRWRASKFIIGPRGSLSDFHRHCISSNLTFILPGPPNPSTALALLFRAGKHTGMCSAVLKTHSVHPLPTPLAEFSPALACPYWIQPHLVWYSRDWPHERPRRAGRKRKAVVIFGWGLLKFAKGVLGGESVLVRVPTELCAYSELLASFLVERGEGKV
jgi:hypothetical protein